MRVPFALTAALAALAATAAPAATRDFAARDFTQVDLRAAADVTIHTGSSFSVHADGDQSLVDGLTADVRRGVLVLGWTPDSSVHRIGHRHLDVTITMPRTTSVAIGGAGSIALDRGSGPAFGASVAGAGSIKVATLAAGRTVLAMSGTGEIVVAGTTDMIEAYASGVGSIDARGLAAGSGRIAVSGTGEVKARIDGPADVSLSGIGDVAIDGHPTCTVHKSGLGNVRCG
jgi:hypothetical protein